MSEKLSRQQIYDRIRESSKDTLILEEMQRLGFWETSSTPSLPEMLIRKEADLSKELNRLLAEDKKYGDQEAMLKEMRKARMKQAKEKREQTRQLNKQKRIEKARNWQQSQLSQIIYLGQGVSGGLNHTEPDRELLQRLNLPVFSTASDIAESMQLEVSKLRYLLYQRKVSRISHYHVFEIAKKTGGTRRISAPKQQLKQLQNWVLNTILNCLPAEDTTHGFVRKRSIVTNAQPHLQQDIVINVDLKDFFPTITYARVKGLFHKLGYSEQAATIFALICTQAETSEVEMDGISYYVQKGHRFLPQGSPASPAISNLIAYKMDKKIQGLAAKLNFNYTRYADDLSFSTSADNRKNIARLLYFLRKIIESEGFAIHPDKTHIMRSSTLQKVTGIVVNEKLNIERKKLRKFRALLHNIKVNGWQQQQWGKARNLVHAIAGYIHYIQMVNPGKGQQFKEELDKIIAMHGYPVIIRTAHQDIQTAPKDIPDNDPAPADQLKDWWDLFS